VVECVDLVITVDTALAHLAGALGRPTWVILPFPGDWRWLRDRADSPWYPCLQLFRQSPRRRWDEVFSAVRGALVARLAGRTGGRP
jgi:ADP-heptose:LPS heptosyltransferase